MAKILVADDEVAICEMIKTLLSAHIVHTVNTGAALHDVLQRGGYDLVISNIMLPDLLGPDAYDLSGSKTPVVYISGRVPRQFEHLSVVLKPFSVNTLLAAVEKGLT
jgi:DNA-binding response OmpR family regulator